MQTVSVQQSSKAYSNPLIFPCHRSESATQDTLHVFHVCGARYMAVALFFTLAMSVSVTARPSAMCISITSVPNSLIKSRSIS